MADDGYGMHVYTCFFCIYLDPSNYAKNKSHFVVDVAVHSLLAVPLDFFLDCSWVEAQVQERGRLVLDHRK